MDKDVQVRLAAIEDKIDLLLRHLQMRKPIEYTISFSGQTVDGDSSRILKALCTTPPVRGD